MNDTIDPNTNMVSAKKTFGIDGRAGVQQTALSLIIFNEGSKGLKCFTIFI